MYCTFLILELKHSFLPRYSIHVYMQISAVMHQAHKFTLLKMIMGQSQMDL